MKIRIFKSISVIAILIATLFASNSCNNLFNNPLKDKETGDDITLLLLDNNFFDTKINIHLVDQETNKYIDNDELTVEIFGQDINKIVTLAGNKKTSYTVSNGLLELALDPNYEVDSNNPIEFSIFAETEEYKWYSIPMEVFITESGKTDVVVKMIYEGEEHMKSAKAFSVEPPFDLNYTGIPTEDVIKTYYDQVMVVDGVEYFYELKPKSKSTSYQNVTFTANFTGDPLLIKGWGYNGYYSTSSSSERTYITTPLETSGNYASFKKFRIYAAQIKTGTEKCETGITINVSAEAGVSGTASFPYTLTFSDGSQKTGIIGGSSFPFSSNINPIYYPGNNTAVTLTINGDSQYNLSENSFNLSSPCEQQVNVTASQKSDLQSYKLISTISCKDGSVGAAPTITGRFKIKDSDNPWSPFSFSGGKATLQLIAGETYSIIGTYDDTSASFDLPTNAANISAAISSTLTKYPELENVTISFDDGLDVNNNQVIRIGVIYTSEDCPFD